MCSLKFCIALILLVDCRHIQAILYIMRACFSKLQKIDHIVKIRSERYFQQGLSVSAVEALPVYVRDKVADKPKSKTVLPGTGD